MLYFQSKKENVMEYKNGELDNKVISLMKKWRDMKYLE